MKRLVFALALSRGKDNRYTVIKEEFTANVRASFIIL